MAYLAFADAPGTTRFAPTAFERLALDPGVTDPAARRTGFSALEWSVVAIAERDKLSTLRTPGRVAVALGTLFGDKPNPQLADTRLEALRRIAVLSWHFGYTIPGDDVRAFVEAGYTLDQYETLVDSISAGRAARNGKARR
ncbi:hypothetical protein [Sphingomonas sp.]|uniref:hypothetical protein n=1 Tax=Sphingomonas sp. TaxID=28214 RepID=UPI002B6D0438|nr:hypothetical protein [Sphingomonas sp.]HWK36095.1 hypothetical protein [Sphingomonas sp.]